ncbi:MAG: DegT/DnrJ/EryC1/StrS family aminotransferase [Phycisphaeraceae bacterium]
MLTQAIPKSPHPSPLPKKEGAGIPYIDLARQHAPLREELLAACAQVIDSGQFILGPQVAAFEEAFARLCGTRHAIGVSNGTDALVLALRALGIGACDEVITAPNSFVASASAIALVGATPVFADVDDDMNLDPLQVAARITPRTRAIMPVHLTGRPADMSAIMHLAQWHKLHVIEDAAQAVLAEHAGRRVGSLGHIGCFSMHPLKTLSACGDAGAITTNDDVLAQRLRTLRNLGLRSREQCEAWSGNCRLDTMQAAMLLVKLRHVEGWTQARRGHAAHYRQALANLDSVRTPADGPHPGDTCAYHTFVIQADRRDELKSFLAAHGIQTAIHYPIPIHLQDAAQPLGYAPGSFPVAERLAQRILSLPIYPELTSEQVDYIAATIRRFYGR